MKASKKIFNCLVAVRTEKRLNMEIPADNVVCNDKMWLRNCVRSIDIDKNLSNYYNEDV